MKRLTNSIVRIPKPENIFSESPWKLHSAFLFTSQFHTRKRTSRADALIAEPRTWMHLHIRTRIPSHLHVLYILNATLNRRASIGLAMTPTIAFPFTSLTFVLAPSHYSQWLVHPSASEYYCFVRVLDSKSRLRDSHALKITSYQES